jgi:hypothetical protein
MLDDRETNILRSVIATETGPVAEGLARRLASSPLDPSTLAAAEREAALRALDAYVATKEAFGALAADVARTLRGGPDRFSPIYA